MVGDVVAALQNGARADLDFFADNTKRTDVRGGVNFGGSGNDGGGVNAGGKMLVREKKKGSTLAKAILALATRIRTFFSEVKGPSIRMAEAALSSALAKNFSFSAKVRSPALAVEAGAKPVNVMEPSPRTSPWSSFA